jgi:hypothetical protein
MRKGPAPGPRRILRKRRALVLPDEKLAWRPTWRINCLDAASSALAKHLAQSVHFTWPNPCCTARLRRAPIRCVRCARFQGSATACECHEDAEKELVRARHFKRGVSWAHHFVVLAIFRPGRNSCR